MGWKSTQTLTRAAAESRFIDLYVEAKAARRRTKIQPLVEEMGWVSMPYMSDMPDVDLETRHMVEIYHKVDASLREPKWKIAARVEMAPYDDTQLADALERLSDECGGTYNFTISEYADHE